MATLPRTRSNKQTNLLISQGGVELSDLEYEVSQIRQELNAIVLNPATVVVPPSVNQLRNGSYSHSWASWFDTGLTANTNRECFPWYSQPVVDAQPMISNNTADGNYNISWTTANVNTGTSTIDLVTAHWLITGTPIRLTTTGGLPSPLVINTTYYVIAASTTTIQVALSVANALAGTEITLTTQGGLSNLEFNYTLKQEVSTIYSDVFSDWDWVTGTARLNGDTDVSTYFSPTTVDPSYSFYAGITCVRANEYITCSEDVRIGAGLYAKSTAKAGWDWVYGAFTPTAEVFNGTTVTTTSRDYVVHAITDRGFTVQSPPITVATAPSDANFTSGGRVVISWQQVLNYGIISYDIYRNTGGTYLLLESIVTGQLTYIDNNVGTSAVGYPSADFDELVAFTATQQGTIQSLSYSGDPLVNQWGTIPYAIRVPYNYDKSDTILGFQYWLRFYITGQNANGRLDLQVTDGSVELNSADVTSAAGQFSSTDPNMVGLDITITDSSGNTLDTTIAAVNSATAIELTDVWPDADATDVTVYIHGGAPSHPILMDLTFLDYRAGTGFAPNNEDISPDRGVPPVQPNGSTQGGSGSGGGDSDGIIRCVSWEENVLTENGVVLGRDLTKGMLLPNGYGSVNKIHEVKYGLADIWLIETQNGVQLQCTLTKQIYVSKKKKKRVDKLKVGDIILTSMDGKVVPSPIRLKTKIQTKVPVVQIGLKPDDHFLAGQNGFIVCSNSKPVVV